MPNVDIAMAKKSIKRKSHPRVVNILKESVEITTIIKQILELGLNLIVDELLASTFAVEKRLTKTFSENKAIQFSLNTLGLAESLETTTPYS